MTSGTASASPFLRVGSPDQTTGRIRQSVGQAEQDRRFNRPALLFAAVLAGLSVFRTGRLRRKR
ncbi:hypothetical protein [Saccharopolyspora sp. NPDC002376]